MFNKNIVYVVLVVFCLFRKRGNFKYFLFAEIKVVDEDFDDVGLIEGV